MNRIDIQKKVCKGDFNHIYIYTNIYICIYIYKYSYIRIYTYIYTVKITFDNLFLNVKSINIHNSFV